jgi:hypothetical protein
VAALDASIARGDLETSSQDLAHLLGRPVTPLTDVVGAAYAAVPDAARGSREQRNVARTTTAHPAVN